MNQIQELRLHVEALLIAVDQDPKFFASIIHNVRRLNQVLTSSTNELTQAELKILGGKIEEFFRK